jgi:hypothetical protein
VVAALAVLGLMGTAPAQGQPRGRPAGKPASARPALGGGKKPGAPLKPSRVGAPAELNTAALGTMLKALGYGPTPEGAYHRVRVEEEGYGYFIDFSLSKSGDWLVCMAHLAPIPDLTKLPSSPLLGLLAANDSLLGVCFSYDRVNGQIMLNASVPNRRLDAGSVRNLVEGMKSTIRETHGLWDPAAW